MKDNKIFLKRNSESSKSVEQTLECLKTIGIMKWDHHASFSLHLWSIQPTRKLVRFCKNRGQESRKQTK